MDENINKLRSRLPVWGSLLTKDSRKTSAFKRSGLKRGFALYLSWYVYLCFSWSTRKHHTSRGWATEVDLIYLVSFDPPLKGFPPLKKSSLLDKNHAAGFEIEIFRGCFARGTN